MPAGQDHRPLALHQQFSDRQCCRKTVAARGFVSGRGPLDFGLADANTFADDRTEDSGRDSASVMRVVRRQ